MPTLVCQKSVPYPAGFQPVHTLEDEIYYLEHILPERNRKDNLLADYGIVVKGTDTVIGSVDFNHRHDDEASHGFNSVIQIAIDTLMTITHKVSRCKAVIFKRAPAI